MVKMEFLPMVKMESLLIGNKKYLYSAKTP